MIRSVYSMLLRLYPARVRRDFGSEMLGVFEQASRDAVQQGRLAYLVFAAREMGGLLVNLVAEGVQMKHKRGVIQGALAGFLIAGAFAWGWMSQPYTSSAIIRVVAPQVPERFVPAQVPPDRGRFNMLMQEITSRSSLRSMIEVSNLYPDKRARIPLDDVVADMRKEVKFTQISNEALSISFTYPDRIMAQKVTAELISRMMAEFYKIQVIETQQTVQFLKESSENAGSDWEQALAKLGELQRSGKEIRRATLDADIARQRYSELRSKLAEAEMMATLQKRQQGQTLELLDPASLPAERALPIAALVAATCGGAMLGWVVSILIKRRTARRNALAFGREEVA